MEPTEIIENYEPEPYEFSTSSSSVQCISLEDDLEEILSTEEKAEMIIDELSKELRLKNPSKVSINSMHESCVYTVEDRENRTHFLKFNASPNDDTRTENFIRESTISDYCGLFYRKPKNAFCRSRAGTIKHPSFGDVHYLISEKVPGNTLDFILRDLSTYQKAEVISEVATKLEFLHGLNWVHGDVKLQNIMHDEETENTTLIDLGAIQNKGDEITQLTIAYATPGTAEFLYNLNHGNNSRAKKLKKYAYANPKNDIYALGITAHQLFTGNHPFGNDIEYVDSDEALNKIRKYHKRKIKIEPTEDKLLNDCLEKTLNQKYKDIRDFNNDFRDAFLLPR